MIDPTNPLDQHSSTSDKHSSLVNKNSYSLNSFESKANTFTASPNLTNLSQQANQVRPQQNNVHAFSPNQTSLVTGFMHIKPLGHSHVLSFAHHKLSFIISVNAVKLFIVLLLIWFGILSLSLAYGTHNLSISQVWETLLGNPPDQVAQTVVWQLRFPRALVASFTGMMLALSGASLQNVTRNPLADPSLVGVNQGAGLAIIALIVAFPDVPYYYRPMAAFVGVIIVAILIQSLSLHKRGNQTMRFMLTGIGIAAFISALINAFLTYGNLDRAVSALAWLSGSVSSVTWNEVTYISFALVILVPLTLLVSRSMSALRFSTETAISLGVNVTRVRFALITLSVTLAAVSVAAVGPIAFIGLVAPHIARRLVRCSVGMHLLLSALVGGVLVSLADFLGRTLFSPIEIPAGLFTALMGVPIFVILIIRANAKSNL